MTVQEIYSQFFSELATIKGKLPYYQKDFRRKGLKASNFPFTLTYEYTTSIKKNQFFLTFTALERGQAEKPLVSLYGIYTRPEGKYLAEINPEIGEITIYPPHYFKRYRERVLKAISRSNEELIRIFIQNSWGYIATAVNKEQQKIYQNFEVQFNNEIVSFAAATNDGYCFGERQGNINIMKTIISDDMLFDDQKALFAYLRKAFDHNNKLKYGKEIKKFG